MMKIYVASSWRNEKRQQEVVAALRAAGHDVYDYRNPGPGEKGFSFADIDPAWESWTPEQHRQALTTERAMDAFERDMGTLMACDACVLVAPCGRSAHLELGFAVGALKRTAVLIAPGEAELMLSMADELCVSMEELLATVACWSSAPMLEMMHQDLADRLPWGGMATKLQRRRAALTRIAEIMRGGAQAPACFDPLPEAIVASVQEAYDAWVATVARIERALAALEVAHLEPENARPVLEAVHDELVTFLSTGKLPVVTGPAPVTPLPAASAEVHAP